MKLVGSCHDRENKTVSRDRLAPMQCGLLRDLCRVARTWAADHLPGPVEDVMWDEYWGFPRFLIRIEEHKLVPSGDQGRTPEEWIVKRSSHDQHEL